MYLEEIENLGNNTLDFGDFMVRRLNMEEFQVTENGLIVFEGTAEETAEFLDWQF